MRNHYDTTDRQIIEILQHKSNISNLKLSKSIGMSPAATLERVRRLEKKGLIKDYTLSLDIEKMQLYTHAILMLSLYDLHQNTLQTVQQHMEKYTEVITCYQVLGKWDLYLYVVAQNVKNLQNFITQNLSTLQAVKTIHTAVITHTLKKNGIVRFPHHSA